MRLWLAVVATALASSMCVAEEETATIAGAGWVTCAEFAQKYKQRPQPTESYFFAWAQGYMSGVNQAILIRKNLRGWRLKQEKQHIRAYCDNHPLANVVAAVQDLFNNLPNLVAPNSGTL